MTLPLTDNQVDHARRLAKMNRQTAMSFDRPRPEILFRPGSQNERLYRRLLQGPVTNDQIVHEMHILKYTGRLSEVREAIRPCLMDIEAQRIGSTGRWVYQLRGGGGQS